MEKLAICIANGCEEVEALTVVDLLRRAEIEVEMVSIHEGTKVTGAHGITFETDTTAKKADWDSYTGVILPGGMPGTNYLKESDFVRSAVKELNREGKLVAAICAAPTVLAHCGVLEGKNATCYPGLEDQLTGAAARTEAVVRDGHIITSRGPGTAVPFGLELVAYFLGDARAEALAKEFVYQ